MSKVLDKLKGKEHTLLICEKVDNELQTRRLITNIGIIEKPDFGIGRSFSCFSESDTTMVFVKDTINCDQIKQIEFEI